MTEESVSVGTPSVSIVIPIYRGGERFVLCMESIARLDPKPAEVFVVADGALEADLTTAKRFGAQVIPLARRGGPARARNAGARAAGGEIVFFVDADVTVGADAVARVAGIFSSEPSVAAVIGSYDDAPGATNFLSQYRNLFHHYTHQRGNVEASTFWGACGAVRRDVFLAHGGFDEGYSAPAIEDIELGYRLKDAGCELRLCRDLQVKHLKVWTAWSIIKTDFFYRALPWTQLILRSGRAGNDLNLRLSSRVSIVLLAMMTALLVGGIFRPILLVYAGGAAILILAVNAPVYGFFFRKRGLWFAIRVVPWHWLYYAYGAAAFAVGTVGHVLSDRGRPAGADIEAKSEARGSADHN